MTTTIAARGTAGHALSALLSKGSLVSSALASKASAFANANGHDRTTTVDLSDQAKALLQQATAEQTALLDLPASFDELVTKRTEDFAKKLVEAFTAENIPVDEAISLSIDSSGTIHADGPYKKRIEQYFKDNPEAAKEFKAVATLNALRATLEALRLYNEEKKAAATKEQQVAASDRYTMRSMYIFSLSGLLTLKDGKITSAAMDYAKSLSDPLHVGKASPRQSTDVLV
jgi:putative NADH-flavin reductase